MSVNDVVTAVLAFGAILVSVVALVINDIAGKRAARSALTDLALKVSEKTAKYRNLGQKADKYTPMHELEVLIRQADYLVNEQLRPRLEKYRKRSFFPPKPQFPESVAITLAQALEVTQDPWWADRYWAIAASTNDKYHRALTKGYWATALCDRYEYDAGKDMAEEAVNGLDENSGDACIVKGDIYYSMADHDPDRKAYWLRRQQEEYNKMPSGDERYKLYFKDLKDAGKQKTEPTEANAPELGAIAQDARHDHPAVHDEAAAHDV